MNKKFMAMLLVIVMVVSMVPVTAMAATCEGGCIDGWVSIAPGSHKQGCPNCGTFTSPFPVGCYDDDQNGNCDGCGAAIGHTHAYTIVTPNNNGTHKKSCACGEGFDIPCDFTNGGVCVCGASNVPACQHPADDRSYTDNGNGTHKITCECGDVIAEAATCKFDGGRCVCGARKAGCQHDMLTYWKDNGNGTHKITCDCGHIVAEAAEHIFEGTSCKCGAAKPVVECTHEDTGIVNRGENHEIWCKDCTWNEFKAHTYKNGVCECGAVNPCTHKWQSVYNQGETHDVLCRDCPEILQTGVAHDFTNGDCPCGATHTCDFAHSVTSNNNGTHNVNCICGRFVQANCLDNDADGKCDSCGYTKYVAPQEPVQLPAYAAASTVGLDNIPKTGNVFVEWLYALIFG